MSITIYALVDPRTDCVLYIGQTRNARNRYSSHCNPRRNDRGPRVRWIWALKKINLRPQLIELEVVEEAAAAITEHFWISSCRAAGALLLNLTDGDAAPTPEHRAKISASHVGMKASAATRAKLTAQRTGLQQTAETVEKRRQKLRDRSFQQETLAKMTASAQKRQLPSDTREKLSKLAQEQWARQRDAGFKIVKQPVTAAECLNALETLTACGGSKSRAAKQLDISRKRLRLLLQGVPPTKTPKECPHSALEACGGNKVQAAKRLGISRGRLYRLLTQPPRTIP